MKDSKGHICWVGDYEYYTDGHDIHRGHKTDVIDVRTHYRIGRWFGPDRKSTRDEIKKMMEEGTMPSVSKKQQQAAGMALSAKRGEISPSELKGAAKEMYDSMSEKQLEDFAKTKTNDLPEKVVEELLRMNEIARIHEE